MTDSSPTSSRVIQFQTGRSKQKTSLSRCPSPTPTNSSPNSPPPSSPDRIFSSISPAPSSSPDRCISNSPTSPSCPHSHPSPSPSHRSISCSYPTSTPSPSNWHVGQRSPTPPNSSSSPRIKSHNHHLLSKWILIPSDPFSISGPSSFHPSPGSMCPHHSREQRTRKAFTSPSSPCPQSSSRID